MYLWKLLEGGGGEFDKYSNWYNDFEPASKQQKNEYTTVCKQLHSGIT